MAIDPLIYLDVTLYNQGDVDTDSSDFEIEDTIAQTKVGPIPIKGGDSYKFKLKSDQTVDNGYGDCLITNLTDAPADPVHFTLLHDGQTVTMP